MAVGHQNMIRVPRVYFHVLVFSCFAITQPLLDLLGNYPEFFIAHDSDKFDLLMFVVFLTYLLPIPVIVVLVVLKAVLFNALKVMSALLIFLFAGLTYLPLVSLTGYPGLYVVFLSGTLAVATSWLYFTSDVFQGFCSLLGLMLIVTPAYFLFFSPVSTLLEDEVDPEIETKFSSPSQVPVIVVIFDEFPLSAIMNEELGIDEVNFPNFARLAKMSYWFRNGTTVAESTVLAVPAIMSGNYPKKFSKPTFSAYPTNIFTLLRNSHRMNVAEAGPTRLCPKSICDDSEWVLPRDIRFTELLVDVFVIFGHHVLPEGMSDSIPAIHETWRGFAPDGEEGEGVVKRLSHARMFDLFLKNIRPGIPEGLHLIHIEMPHIPYEYLPSGKRYPGGSLIPGKNGGKWGKDQLLINQAYQRLLLQIGATDRMMGELLDRLEAFNLLDPAVLVVTADHGVAFLPERSRRGDLRNNIHQSSILPVPLFIKVPNQTHGVVDDRNAEVIDILPTIAEFVISDELPLLDGQNLVGNSSNERELKTLYRGYKKMWVRQLDPHLNHKNKIVAWKYKHFYDDEHKKLSLYDKGPYGELVGKHIRDIERIVTAKESYTLDDSISLDIDLKDEFVPVHLFGQLDLSKEVDRSDLVFAINGVVQATSHSYSEHGVNRFSVMVPESAFESGINTFDLFVVKGIGKGRQLDRLSNKANDLDRYRLIKNPSNQWVLDIAGAAVIVEDAPSFGTRVKTTIEGRDSLRITTEIKVEIDQRNQFQILVFEADKCIYRHTLVTNKKGKYPSSFVLPVSKFEDFDGLPIRLFAVDSEFRSQEMAYYSRYPYL